MKVRVKVRPSGLLNTQEWPEVGGTVDLPDAVAESMIEAGSLEKVEKAAKVEKRPAAKNAKTETR